MQNDVCKLLSQKDVGVAFQFQAGLPLGLVSCKLGVDKVAAISRQIGIIVKLLSVLVQTECCPNIAAMFALCIFNGSEIFCMCMCHAIIKEINKYYYIIPSKLVMTLRFQDKSLHQTKNDKVLYSYVYM